MISGVLTGEGWFMFLSLVVLIALCLGSVGPKIEARTEYDKPSEAYAYAVQARGRLSSETGSQVPQTPWLAVDFGVQQRAKTWCPAFDADKQTGEELYFLALLCRDARDYGKAKVAVKHYLASSEQENAPNARLLLALCRMMTETLDDAWQTLRIVLQNDPIGNGEELSIGSVIEDESRTSEEKALQWSLERYTTLLGRAQSPPPDTSRVSYHWVVLAGADLVHRYWLSGDKRKADFTLTELNVIAEAHKAEVQGWLRQQLQWANMEMKPAPAIPVLKPLGIASDHKLIEMGRVEVVSFFFLGCAPCIEEFHALSKLQKRYPREKLLVVDATTYEANTNGATSSHAAIESSLNRASRKKAPDLAMIITSPETFQNYHLTGFPVVAVIDKAGRVRYVGLDINFEDDDPVGSLISQLVRE